MIIFGVDPGTRVTGYACIVKENGVIRALDYGCIRPPAQIELAERYRIIFDGIEELLDRYRPDALAIESQFVLKNVQSAIKLGIAKGMAMLAATRRKIPITEYAPTYAKRAVAGQGQASKAQVQRMMQALLKLPQPPTPEDAADALALAVCHANQQEMNHVRILKRDPSRKKTRLCHR